MTWLYVPSACAAESVDSISESASLHALERSATWRGKHSASNTWQRRCKRVGWMKRLSGRIWQPSMAERGVERWISSLVATPASHSPSQASERA